MDQYSPPRAKNSPVGAIAGLIARSRRRCIVQPSTSIHHSLLTSLCSKIFGRAVIPHSKMCQVVSSWRPTTESKTGSSQKRGLTTTNTAMKAEAPGGPCQVSLSRLSNKAKKPAFSYLHCLASDVNTPTRFILSTAQITRITRHHASHEAPCECYVAQASHVFTV